MQAWKAIDQSVQGDVERKMERENREEKYRGVVEVSIEEKKERLALFLPNTSTTKKSPQGYTLQICFDTFPYIRPS